MDILLGASLILFVLLLALSALLTLYSDPQEVDEEERKIVEHRESKQWQQNHS